MPKWGLALMVSVVALVAGLTACGSDNTDEKVRQAREEGAKTERDEQRLRRLERELREQKKQPGGQVAPNSSGGAPAPTGGKTICGGGVSVGANTSCPFGKAVKASYEGAGGSGDKSVVAHSPTTGKTYTMQCSGGSPHVCTGGNSATVYFP